MTDKFLKANDPDYDMCKKCVGTGIMEVGISAAKRVCNNCNGEGYVKKMSKCGWCGGTGRVGSLFLGEQCPSCDGTGIVLGKKISVNVNLSINMTKIDGLMIKCGEKSLWVSKEAVENILSGKSDGAGRLASPIGIRVTPNVVKIPIANVVKKE